MTEKDVFCSGCEAVGWGAIFAGCHCFFGYPITPQNEIPEFMAEELPKAGGVFVQSECELAAMNMVWGAATTGLRAMTSTSSPGFSLMQEAISSMAAQLIPGVVVNVVRMSPGPSTIHSGQTDYRQVTKGGGHGGYRCVVLAPCSPQETFDLTQLAFFLADKYRLVSIVLMDRIGGQMEGPVKLRTIDFGPLPSKDWAVTGRGKHPDGKRRLLMWAAGQVVAYHQERSETYQKIEDCEVRYETYKADDATILMVAYGSTARMAMDAVDLARSEGLKVGLFRPVTLWPFPKRGIREIASHCERVLVIEDSQGQLVEDVDYALRETVPIHLLGVWGRHSPGPDGLIYPERIFTEVKNII